MSVENGVWIMHGVRENDSECLHSPEDIIQKVNEIGFLPLFKNEVEGFSVEEYTVPHHWWCDDPDKDPWIWRKVVAGSHEVAYGKFFDKKAGFVSLKWLPAFANYRRDGYDFDALWDDEKATYRQKKIMDVVTSPSYAFEIRKKAGFSKDGEKNFEGTLTDLQMHLYLTLCDFRQRVNKMGAPYGWAISMYDTPEDLWGKELLQSEYDDEPSVSLQKILCHLKSTFPNVEEKEILKLMK